MAKNRKTKIGGQALIEGVMMKGADNGAMACRLPSGDIDVEIWDENNGKNAPKYKKIPIIRGIASFITSLVGGMNYTMRSAEKQFDENGDEVEMHPIVKTPTPEERIHRRHVTKEEIKAEREEAEKREAEAEKRRKEEKRAAKGKPVKEEKEDDSISTKGMNILMVFSSILGFALALFLFVYLPKRVVAFVPAFTVNRIVRSLCEGVIKIAIFIAYMWAVGLSKETRRTYEYHGAEHKTIACYEARLPLTIENVRKQRRLHPRCGTSFIFIVLIVSIIVMCFVPFTIVWQRVLCSLILLPIIVGVSFEFIRYAGMSDSLLAKALSWPGMQLQRITTREPSDDMIECAIEALKPCIPEDEADDVWGK